MTKPFVPFDKFERECLPEGKTLQDTMQENCNERLAPQPEPCSSPCVPYWQPTGEQSCTESASLEIEEADGCGNTRWTRTKKLVTWVDTDTPPVIDDDTGQITTEQVNQCGETRTVVTTLPSSQVTHANTASLTLNGTGRSSSPLSGTVRISIDANNLIEIRDDGAYVLLPISAVPTNVLERITDGLFVGLSDDAGNALEYRSDGFFFDPPEPGIVVDDGATPSFKAGVSSNATKYLIQHGQGTALATGEKGASVAIEFPVPYAKLANVHITVNIAAATANGALVDNSVTDFDYMGPSTGVTVNFNVSDDDDNAGWKISNDILFTYTAFGYVEEP